MFTCLARARAVQPGCLQDEYKTRHGTELHTLFHMLNSFIPKFQTQESFSRDESSLFGEARLDLVGWHRSKKDEVVAHRSAVADGAVSRHRG